MRALLVLLLLAGLIVPIAYDGGFGSTSQWVFAGSLVRPRLSNTLLLGGRGRVSAGSGLVAVAAVIAVSVAAGLLSNGALSARRFDTHESFSHGRTWMWSAG